MYHDVIAYYILHIFQVLEVFKIDSETQQSKYPIPSQILMIYYVLLYHDYYLSNLRALSK